MRNRKRSFFYQCARNRFLTPYLLSAGCSLFRKLDLPEDIHFRLRMLAYQCGMKLSECAVKVLDKALPKWNVDRIG